MLSVSFIERWSLCILLSFFSISLKAQPVNIPAIENALLYVEWPKVNNANSVIKFAVFDNILIYNELKANFSKNIAGKQLIFLNITVISDLKKDINVIYIGNEQAEFVEPILKAIVGKPILSVAENLKFAKQGVHICFDGKGKIFEINNTAAKKSNLEISYLMLQIANKLH